MNRVERFWSHVDRSGGPDACWPWTLSCDGGGYGLVSWPSATAQRGTSSQGAHRIALTLSGGLPDSSLDACHTCDYPPCCNPRHMFAGTAQVNMRDSSEKGRSPVGARHPRSKFTPETARELRALVAAGSKHHELAERYGVSLSTVSRVANGQRHREIQ